MAEPPDIRTGDIRTGRCRCGAVRFRAEGKPLWVAHCHCDDCRRTTSSAITTYAGYARDRFAFTAGTPSTYNSSPGVTRTFCGTCGSPLTYEGARWPDEIHVFVPAFDDPNGFSPRAHVYVAEQLSWLHLDDGLKRFAKTSKDGPPL
jgi:hypothetical protein